MKQYPEKLDKIVHFFESFEDEGKRENLLSYAERFHLFLAQEDDVFDLYDIRHDKECVDEVGIFLKVDPHNKAKIRMSLGDKVQTLTRALSAIMCEGFSGAKVKEILQTKEDFVPKIIGAQLVRARSQTMYYVFRRIQEICQKYERLS
ncbi:MAG: SufE family protein [Verrucomicrobiota bacterium]